MKKLYMSIPFVFSPCVLASSEFDLSLIQLNGEREDIDLSVFNNPEGGIAGIREVSIYVNDTFFGRRELNFKNDESGALKPEVNRRLLLEMEVMIEPNNNTLPYFDASNQKEEWAEEFFNIEKVIPHSHTKLVEGEGRLDISIPQAYFKTSKYKVSPDLWDDGVPALLLDYNITGNRNKYSSEGRSTSSLFSNFTSGANLAGWRWRGLGTYNYINNGRYESSTFDFSRNYLEKDIRQFNSTFLAGRISTVSSVLDNVMFEGVQLKNNKEMLKSGLYTYAPVIRGVANSNAEVELNQNGRVVYKTNVPPGPFELDELNIPIYGGDVLVTIKEASGEIRSFIQTYSTLAEMLRPGIYDYNLSMGKTQYGDFYNNSQFIQGDYAFGIDNGITLYTAGLFAEKYYAGAIGSTYSFGAWGAASADITFSRSHKNNEGSTGQSYNLRYSKSAISSGTTVTLASYRYATRDFYSFEEHLLRNNQYRDYQKTKARWSLLLSQSLFEMGHLNFNGSRIEYWNNTNSDALSLSHTYNWEKIHFSTSYSIDYYDDLRTKKNRQFNFGISVPFSFFDKKDTSGTYFRYGYMDSGVNSSHYVTVYGQLNDKIDYSTQHNWNNIGYSYGSASLNYNGNSAKINGSYTRGNGYSTSSIGMSGSAVMHEKGITFSPDTITNGAVLVNIDGVENASLYGAGGRATDWFGNAVYSGVSFYNRNTVKIDALKLPDNVVLPENEKNVYPSRGSIALVRFDALIGRQGVFGLMKSDGNQVPFGAVVALKGAKVPSTGIVGDGGKVYLAGIPDKGTLEVSWGGSNTCTVMFDLSGEPQDALSEKNYLCS
ncbi:TPA: fimbria/pilus outer membrane usher protein [Raoultella planticola]